MSRANSYREAFVAEIGGPKADKLHGKALAVLREFAQATGCPPGYRLSAWFDERTAAADRAAWDALKSAPQPERDKSREDQSQ